MAFTLLGELHLRSTTDIVGRLTLIYSRTIPLKLLNFLKKFKTITKENYSIEEMLTFYRSNYNQISDMHVLKSLVFFDDVDLSDWPVLSREKDLKWKKVQKKITQEVVRYMKSK